MTVSRTFRRWFAVFVLLVALAGDAWRYSITWYGFGALVLAIGAVSVVLLVKTRHTWRWSKVPYPLVGFAALAVVSITWSAYPAWSAIGALTTVITITAGATIAVLLTRDEVLWALGIAMRIVLAASLLFELFVAVIIRHPILPWWADYGSQKIHPADYWSRDLLFTGDRIQGVMGNSNLLGFVALLGVIVFAVQLAARTVRPAFGVFWLLVAALCIGLSRSATVTVAIIVVAVAAIVLVLLRHARTRRARFIITGVTLVVVALAIAAAIAFSKSLLAILGKSSDFTGRGAIWNTVIQFASQRPVFGWGWISYWSPFTAPFNTPAFRTPTTNGGVQLLQAHDAWLDMWFQLGIIGLIVFGALVVSTVVRSWLIAVEHPRGSVGFLFGATALLPILILTALLAQSVAESRLLIEYGMLLLSLFAVSTKRDLLAVPTT
jgi:O-antigen ligase